MSLSISGRQSRVPPGFRFRPTEEELLHYYLRKKVSNEKIDMDVILEIDINKLEPWDIEETCKIGSTPQNEWYFFSRKDKKYPTGIRTNRATAAGFWKATGRDKIIRSNSKRIGMRKTLVFYMGRAPNGQKSDWIMYEFRLEENISPNSQFNGSSSSGLTPEEDGWVVCRVFKKKNLLRTLESKKLSSLANNVGTQMLRSSRDGTLDEILQYMRKSCKMETEPNNNTTNNMNHLPALSNEVQVIAPITHQRSDSSSLDQVNQKDLDFSDCDTVDRLVASQLQSDPFTQLDFNDNSNLSVLSFSDQEDLLHTNDCNIHVDLWNFTL